MRTAFVLILPVYFLLVTLQVAAQDKIETDRPDQTETSEIVPLHYFQAELGFVHENLDDGEYNNQYPVALLKYGIAKNFELRLEDELETEHVQLIPNPKNSTGFQPLQLGFKTRLLKENKVIPQTSLIAQFGLPFLASGNFKTKHIAPNILLAMKNTISKTLDIGYNIGAEWDGFSTMPQYIFSASLGIELSDKWNMYLEPYTFVHKDAAAETLFDGGIQYYISNDVKVDASAGIGLSEAASDYFISTGLSFRLH